MYILILFIISGVVFNVFMKYKEGNLESVIWEVIKGGFYGVSVYFFIIIVFLPMLLTPLIEHSLLLEDTIYLSSLKGVNGVEGNFFLGCGDVGGEIIYYYLEDGKDNGKIPGKLSYDDIDKIYDEESEPRIEVYRYIIKSEFLRYNFITWKDYKVRYLYVPEGSIKYDFELKPFN